MDAPKPPGWSLHHKAKAMAAIAPLPWRKLVPFAPIVMSNGLDWRGLEAARFGHGGGLSALIPP